MTEIDAPYARFDDIEVTLRDELAIDRTLLANERTLMAYLRSGVTLALAGFTFIELFPESWLRWVGLGVQPIAVWIAVVGVLRWRRMDRAIGGVRDRLLH